MAATGMVPPRPIARLAGFGRNVSWTLVGNLAYAGCQWAMLVALAKLGSLEAVGLFALGLAIVTPIVMFLNLQLRSVQATDAEGRFAFGEYLGLRLLAIALSLAVVATMAVPLHLSLAQALVVCLIAFGKGFESLGDLFHGAFQARERMDLIGRSMAAKGVLSLVAFTAGLAASHGSLAWAVTGMAAAWALVALAYDLPNAHKLLTAEGNAHPLKPSFSLAALGRLTKLALPLGVVYLMVNLNQQVPRYVVAHQLGERALGIFAAIAYVVVAGATVINALGQTASPRLARLYASGDAAGYVRALGFLLALGAAVGAVGVGVAALAGGPLLALMYRPAFAEHGGLFTLVMAGGALAYMASLLGYGLTAAQAFRVQMPLQAIATAGTALACFFLVPSHGLAGAAMALIVGAGLNLGGSLVAVGLTLSSRREARA